MTLIPASLTRAAQIAADTAQVRVADLFCGAGSLSMGIQDALDELALSSQFIAVNHWPTAIDTYKRNHPGARVHCITLDAALPTQMVPEGSLDLLTAGIECTYFSRARGGKPVTDQQRMSAWHVVRWCTELRIDRLLLENVPEFLDWGPVDPLTGKAIKARKGEFFRAWWQALENIGYRGEYRVINCANHGDPTTRKRLFMILWLSTKPVPWPQDSHSKVAGPNVLPWRSARHDVIDWAIRGRSIFNRKRPLSPKTIARIAAGIIKFGWPEPFIVVLRQHCDARGIDLPLPTLTAGGTHVGLVEPFVLKQHFRRDSQSVDDPLSAVTTIARVGVVEPFVLSQASGGAPRAVQDPIPTIPCDGAHALIAPYYGSGSGETCTSIDKPLPTATTKARFGLVVPVTHQDKSNRARSIDDPLPTLTTAHRGELAFVAAAFGERPTQTPRVHDISEPCPSVCAQGRINLVEPGLEYDILFRMLEPHELARAMSISTPERPYRFAGNKTETVRQIGQAVPRRTARALAHALMSAEL